MNKLLYRYIERQPAAPRWAAQIALAIRISLLILTAILLASCAKTTPTLIPTLAVTAPAGSAAPGETASNSPVDGMANGAVVASAEAAPAQVAEISFAAAGFVKTIAVQEGATVKAGDLLASLSNQEELQAVVEASQQSLDSAQNALDRLMANAPLELANAQMEVVKNQKRYDDAVKHLKKEDLRRCDKDTIDLYTRRYEDAKDNLERSRDSNDGSLSDLEQVREAQNVFDTARANYIYCLGFTEQEIAESNAELAVSEAALKQSTDRYALLQKENGLDPEEVARLNAAIATAQASLATARSALERAVVTAPFDCTVIQVNVLAGQAVTPGQPVFVLADISPLLIETTDLSERDVSRVQVGQTAVVTIEALGQTFQGKVTEIDPRASKIGGDVVYKVTIALDEQPENLRWGMNAKVEIQP